MICSICGQEVTKRQSLSIGDGKRACRSHTETQEKALQLADQAKLAKAKKVLAPKKNPERHEGGLPAPRCWICHRPGIRQDEFFAKYLIGTAKLQLQGHAWNPFSPDETVISQFKERFGDKPCLFWVEWKGANTKVRLKMSTYNLVQMTNVMLVCPTCCKEKGFVTMTDERMKSMTIEDMLVQAAIYEVLVQPAIEEIAKRELSV